MIAYFIKLVNFAALGYAHAKTKLIPDLLAQDKQKVLIVQSRRTSNPATSCWTNTWSPKSAISVWPSVSMAILRETTNTWWEQGDYFMSIGEIVE